MLIPSYLMCSLNHLIFLLQWSPEAALTVAQHHAAKAIRRTALEALREVVGAATPEMVAAILPGTVSVLTRIITARDVRTGPGLPLCWEVCNNQVF